jgi:peptidoglycan/LPS O-acetylase OafA/YrhL
VITDPATGPIRIDAAPLGYQPALDGIRAVAVVAVMIFHFVGPDRFTGGLIGVDVFFVLSGFLITNLLLDERHRTGAVSLRGFYHRRALRLFPAMYTLLALVTVAAIVIGREYPTVWAEIGAAAVYSYQWFLAFAGFPTEDSPRVLFHLWSLSVEEWFYFVWPAVLLAGLATARRQRWLLGLAGAWAAWWMGLRLWGTHAAGIDWTGEDPFAGTGLGYAGEVLARLSAMRFDMLIAGCLLAVAIRRAALVPGDRRPAWLAPVAAAGAALVSAELLLAGRVSFFDPFGSIGFNLALVGIVPLVAWIHLVPDGGPGRLLSLPVAVWIGRRSYGLYLWHEVLNVLTPNPGGATTTVVRTGVLFVASLGVAELSWRCIESPFLRRKHRIYGVGSGAPSSRP